MTENELNNDRIRHEADLHAAEVPIRKKISERQEQGFKGADLGDETTKEEKF